MFPTLLSLYYSVSWRLMVRGYLVFKEAHIYTHHTFVRNIYYVQIPLMTRFIGQH